MMSGSEAAASGVRHEQRPEQPALIPHPSESISTVDVST